LKKCQLEVEAICLKFIDMQDERQCMIFPPPRIFRRGKIHFANIVHNSPRGFKEPAVLYPGLEVRHYGFDLKKNPEMEKEKFERTLGLLKKRLEIDPLDFQAYFYLAQVYGSVKDFDRAIEYSIKYIRNKDQVTRFNPSIYFSLVQACMAKNEPKMADKWLAESMRELPKDIDICMALLDYGVWQNKPHVVSAAAEKFIISYESMLANPLSMGSRFVFNFNEHALIKVLFHLSMIRLSQGVNCMVKLTETLEKIEDDQAKLVKDDIRRETQKLNKLDFIKFVEEKV
jgi:tetratricopeptide (TPR) repeat protein